MKYINLTQDKIAIVDDEDYEWLSKYTWRYMSRYVVRTQIKGEYKSRDTRKAIAIHTMIMNTPKGLQVDHINCNPLDNRRCNLRLATASQNQANKKLDRKSYVSKYRGVCWSKQAKKWLSHICHQNKEIHIGYFYSILEAAKAYDEKAKELFGEFARLNFS